MPLLNGLTSHWKLDEASGDALDSYGGHGLDDHNSVGSATGKIGNARDFEKDNSTYFSTTSVADHQTGDIDFHICGWIKLESLPSSGASANVILAKGRVDQAANFEYGLFVNDSDNKLNFWVSDGATVTSVNATTFGALSAGVFYFVEGWHDATNNQLGVSVNLTADTTSYSAGVQNAANDLRVGADLFGRFFDGLIDEVSFRKAIPSTQDRSDLYNGGAGNPYPFTTPRTASSAPSTSDAAARSLSAPRTATSAPSTSDAAARVAVLLRSLADSPSTSDAAARSLSAPRSSTSAPSTSDAAARAATLPRALAEAPSTADAAARAVITSRTLTEAPSTVDAASTLRSVPRTAADAPSTADAASRQITLARARSESPSTADVANAAQALLRVAAESPSTVDSVVRVNGGARSASEAPSTNAAATRAIVLARLVASGPSTSDAVAALLVYARTASASPATSGTITVASVLSRSASASPSTSDAATYVTFLPRPRRLRYAIPGAIELTYARPGRTLGA